MGDVENITFATPPEEIAAPAGQLGLDRLNAFYRASQIHKETSDQEDAEGTDSSENRESEEKSSDQDEPEGQSVENERRTYRVTMSTLRARIALRRTSYP